MKVYLAGPMTGIPQFNFPAFDAEAKRLTDLGHEVISPAELDDPEDRAAALDSVDGAMNGGHHMGKTHGDFLARDVKIIADGGIEAVVTLPGWERSKGARHETFVAYLNRLPVYPSWSFGAGSVPYDEAQLAEAWLGLSPRDLMFIADPYWDCSCGFCGGDE